MLSPVHFSQQGFDGGILTNRPAHLLEPDESPDAENFDPGVPGMVRGRKGSVNHTGDTSTVGARCRGLHIFATDTASFNGKGLTAFNGTLHEVISSAGWVTTVTAVNPVSTNANIHCRVFDQLVIMTRDIGTAPPEKWTGVGNFAALGGTPPDARFLSVHKNRLWLFNEPVNLDVASASKFYFSALNDPEVWSGADSSSDYVQPGDGMIINGAESDGDFLYISKRMFKTATTFKSQGDGALYVVSGDTPDDFKIRRIAWFGAINQFCMALTQNFVAFLSTKGLWGVRGSRLVHLSEAVDDELSTEISAVEADSVSIGAVGDYIWISVKTGASTGKTWLYNYRYNRWSKITPLRLYGFSVHPDGTMYAADSITGTGRILKLLSGNTDFDGSAITTKWNTPDLDFGAWMRDKRWRRAYIHSKNQDVTWTMTHKIDGVASADSVTQDPDTEKQIKRFVGLGTGNWGRLWRFQLSASSSTLQPELYGIDIEMDMESEGRR